jgi:hypothetical protein
VAPSPPRADDAPGSAETVLAYLGAGLATLVWVGCVIPGARLSEATRDDEAATALGRGAIFLLPALFLYVTGSVGTTLAARGTALRAALAAGDGFVTLYVAGALSWAKLSDGGLMAIVGVLIVVGLLSLREAVRVVVGGGDAEGEDAPVAPPGGRWGDVRLGLSILVLIAPAWLFSNPQSERASLLAPFFYVAVSAGGARLAKTARGLRLTAALLMALLAAHLVVAIRWVLDEGSPAVAGTTAVGHATVAAAAVVFVLTVARVVLIARRRGEAPA